LENGGAEQGGNRREKIRMEGRGGEIKGRGSGGGRKRKARADIGNGGKEEGKKIWRHRIHHESKLSRQICPDQ